MAEEGSINLKLSAGILIRGRVVFEIKSYCRDNGLEPDIIEDKGIFSSNYHIIIHGPNHKLLQAKNDLESWFDRIQRSQ